MEDPLEQQSGLQLRVKQDGERHVYKAPASGGTVLGLDVLARQKRAEQGKPEPPRGRLSVFDGVARAPTPVKQALPQSSVREEAQADAQHFFVAPAAKRIKLFAAAAEDEEEDGGQGGSAANTDAPGETRWPVQQPRQFRGQRIDTPSRPGAIRLHTTPYSCQLRVSLPEWEAV